MIAPLFFVTLLLCNVLSLAAPFAYDRAINALQRGDVDMASHLIKPVVVHNADDAAVLYDAGRIAAAKKEYAQAKGYFEQATQVVSASEQLKAQAHFNLGNTLVALNDLQSAITQYETSLTIKETNEAAHNLATVKEMLKKQKEEKKQQEQHKKEQDKKQQEEKKKQNQDQSKDDSDKQESEQKNNQQQKQEDEKQGDQNNEQKPKDSDKEREEQQRDQHENGSQQEQEKEIGQQHEDKQKEQQSQQAGKNKEDKQQKQACNKNKQPMDANEWLEQMLALSEKNDAQANKELIKATVNKKMSGSHGQNCW